MGKIVNCWNEWDPLKRVILGRPEGTQIPAPEPGWEYDCPRGGFPLGTWGLFPQEMVDKANEQMTSFATLLERRGIIVDWVEPHSGMLEPRSISTPDWTQLNARGTNNPRDLFLPIGNEIMESPCCARSRHYEYLNLRPLFERYFREDPEFLWTSAPRPRLTDASYEPNYYYNYRHVWTAEEKRQRMRDWRFQLTEQEPLWDAADAARMGKDVFWECSAVTNRSGLDWLKRYFGSKGIRIHPVLFDNYLHPWHIDVNLVPLRPGLAMINPDWPPITEDALRLFKMNDWELIPAERPVHWYDNPLTLLDAEQGAGTSWISMNTLSLDASTVCVEAHETAYGEQLDKLGFEVLPVPFDCVLPFGGSLHCVTLDVCREGGCEDYFPKQIPGY